MGNISGNHDLVRFMGLAGGAVRWDEDQKEAGYQRKIEIIDSTGYRRLQNMLAFIMCIPGVPIIYYGDEIGMVGANDPDNRRMMYFDSWNPKEKKTFEICSKLIHLRRNAMPLMYGDFDWLQKDPDLMIFSRTYNNEQFLITFSKNKSGMVDIPIAPSSTVEGMLSLSNAKSVLVQNGLLTLSIKPYDFQIIKLQLNY